MTLFKKISVTLLAAFCTLFACAMLSACDNGSQTSDSTSSGSSDTTSTSDSTINNPYSAEDDDTNWDYKTYVVYLYLPDGTPVSGVSVQICSEDNCIPTTTNEYGRAKVTYGNSQQDNTVFMHFSETINAEGTDFVDYEGPDGYTLPEGGQEDFILGSTTYSHAWFLTSKVTTFYFVAE